MKLHIDKPVRLIELFAGIGSQAMAMRDIGADFEHYRVVEYDKFAIKSYNAIHGTDFPTMDITKTHGEDLGIVDVDKYCYLLTYSQPCTALSVAGNGGGMSKESGTASSLLWEVERLLNEVENLPQILVMENVSQIHNKKNMPQFQMWLNFLKSKGYTTYYQDLMASDYGVAQSRKRCIAVSVLGDYEYEFPKPIPLTKTMKDYLEDEVDNKYYLTSDKAKALIDKMVFEGKIDIHKDRQSNVAIDMLRRGGCPNLKNVDIAATLTAHESQGINNWANVVVESAKLNMVGRMDGYEVVNSVYDSDDLCPTLSTCGGGGREPKIMEVKRIIYDDYNSNIRKDQNTITTLTTNCGSSAIRNAVKIIEVSNIEKDIPEQFRPFIYNIDGEYYLIRIRRLTPCECWRLMGFSDEDFDKAASVNSKTQLYKQAGNSIVKDVLMHVFKQMF